MATNFSELIQEVADVKEAIRVELAKYVDMTSVPFDQYADKIDEAVIRNIGLYTTGGTLASGQSVITVVNPGQNWSTGGVIELTLGGLQHLYPSGKHSIASVTMSGSNVLITLNAAVTRNTDYNIKYFQGGI
jgi:hypothetical protein